MVDIEKVKFVCMDCESTGLDPKKDHIIEVAAVCFDLNQVYGEFETLVDPKVEIPKESTAIHHITTEMVQGKPTIKEVLPELLKFIDDYIIIGHSIEFDIEIVATSAERCDIPTSIKKNKSIDTLRLARRYGESPTNSLENLRRHFNIAPEIAHRAMSDVIVNMEVFKYLAKDYRTLEQMFSTLDKPILLKEMPLGKHKGRPFKEIPLQFLRWAANKDFDQDLLYSIRTELKRRKQGNQFSQSTNPFQNL